MPRTTFYVQECSTCGRTLQVRVEFLGKLVVCQHCGARFVASQQVRTPDPTKSGIDMVDRADQLLAAAAAAAAQQR